MFIPFEYPAVPAGIIPEYNVVSDSGEISNKQKHVADEYLDQQSCGIIKTQQSGNFASKSYHLVEQI